MTLTRLDANIVPQGRTRLGRASARGIVRAMSAAAPSPLLVGRYAIFDRIAAGGMAAVHVARVAGEGGFARTFAVKRLHPQFALDPDFVAMFLDEARLAARIRHPNVVPTLDIVTGDGELFLVMEYIEGESLSALLRTARDRSEHVPLGIAAGVMAQALAGLHAAHEARNDYGEPLHIVHRDVSPQNVLVGTDGVARVLDFGVAKATSKLHTTREGQLKGKLGYLAPEQILGQPVTRRSDVFAAAVVLWEAIAGTRLFAADSEGEVLRKIMDGVVEAPSTQAADVPAALDAVVMRGLAKEPADRFDTALAMAEALEAAVPTAPARTIGEWTRDLARERLRARAELLGAIESSTATPARIPDATSAVYRTIPDTAPRDDRHDADGERALSSVSVSSDPARKIAGRRSARWWVAGWWVAGWWVALGTAGAAAAAILAMSARRPQPEAPASASPASVAPAASPVPAPQESAVEAAASAASAVAPTIARSATARPVPPSRPAGRTPRPRPASAPAPSGSGLYSRE
jgi:serine/threonine-protein kinase